MKTNRIIQLAAGVLLLTACTSDFYEEYVNGRVPVNLGYEVLTAEERTRTAASTTLNDANIASGDAITVKIKNNGAATSAYTSYTYTAGASGAMTPPSPKPYYPTGSTNIDILAYYPSTAGNSSNFDVQADQTTDANYKASDLMVATVTNQAKTTSTVALAFQHKMAKLVVTATKGDGVNKIQTITLKNVKRRVSFTNTSGAVGSATTISGSTDVTLFKSGTGTSGTGAALIPAQTITGDVIEIVTDQGTAVYNVPAGKAFAANTKYTISVTVNRTAVGATNTITWGSSASLTILPTVTKLRAVITPEGAIPGLFTINADGDQVFFSKGNLQYQASTSTWRFAEHQYDYVGDATNGNVKVGETKSNNALISETYEGWIDLLGWATSGYNSKNPYMTSKTNNDYGPSITSGEWTTSSTSWDWGVHNAISNGGNTAGSGWRTLTGGSGGEWEYLFGTNSSNKRTTTSGILYAKATVNGVAGVILLPDDWSASYHSLTSYNTTNVAYNTNIITDTGWSNDFEAHGAVFLPAAGRRAETSLSGVGSSGYYWSSTADGSSYAYHVIFDSGLVYPTDYDHRYRGFSVRLVRPVCKEVSSATADDLGKIICSKGHIHTNVNDVACGGTAVAMIAYVGSVPGYFDNFLAIALEDASSSDAVWSTQMSAANTWASSHAVTVGSTTYNSCPTTAYDKVTTGGTTSKPKSSGAVKGWRVPSVTDWKYIFAGIGGKAVDNSAVTDGIVYSSGTDSGDSDGSHRALLNKWCGQAWNATTAPQAVQSRDYWSSSERAGSTADAWYYRFRYSKFSWDTKTYFSQYVRACFAY